MIVKKELSENVTGYVILTAIFVFVFILAVVSMFLLNRADGYMYILFPLSAVGVLVLRWFFYWKETVNKKEMIKQIIKDLGWGAMVVTFAIVLGVGANFARG